MKDLYTAVDQRTTPGQVRRAAIDTKKAKRKKALKQMEVVAEKYAIKGGGASIEVIQRILPDVIMVTREFCDARNIRFEKVFPNLTLDVVAHVQAYGLSSRDELLGITTRLIRAYIRTDASAT